MWIHDKASLSQVLFVVVVVVFTVPDLNRTWLTLGYSSYYYGFVEPMCMCVCVYKCTQANVVCGRVCMHRCAVMGVQVW